MTRNATTATAVDYDVSVDIGSISYEVKPAASYEVKGAGNIEGHSDNELRELVRARARELEDAAEAERTENDHKAIGMKRVRAQDWAAMPRTKEDMFGSEPKDATSNRWALEEAKQRKRELIREYRACLEAWIGGDREVVFPADTYLMRRRFNVAVANAPPG